MVTRATHGWLPPLNALRAFEAAARHLNFRLAAEELGVTQGAVAQQVRGLEETLGVVLFQRLPRGLALTVEGEAYLGPVRRAFQLLVEATADLVPARDTLTITAPPSFAARWLIPRIKGFTAQHPELDVRVSASDRLEEIGPRGVDIAIRYGRPPFPGLEARLLVTAEIFPLAAPGYVAGPSPAPADLARYPLLHDLHSLWPVWFETWRVDAPGGGGRGTRFSQSSHAIDRAIAGEGLVLAPLAIVEDDLAAGRLVRPLGEGYGIESDVAFYLVTPRAGLSAKVRAMRDWLVAEAGR